MTGRLVVTFDVACDAAHAFATWTTRTSTWWPRGHTMSGVDDVEITIEPRVDGRIFERTRDGAEFTWGTVTRWEPPARLGFTWHLGQDPAMPTDVLVSFMPVADGECRVVIEHDGWQQFGADADARRRANRSGWQALVSPFTAGATTGRN